MVRKNIHLSEYQIEQLKILSDILDRPYAELVRTAIDNFLEANYEPAVDQ